jgi:hypothetical protein
LQFTKVYVRSARAFYKPAALNINNSAVKVEKAFNAGNDLH